MNTDHFITADSPETIEAFRLLALRQALKLESLGLRHSRGAKASVTVRGILKQAGKAAPAKLPALTDSFAAYLREIGVLVS